MALWLAADCEIGFNGGHGTVAMLLANPELTVHSFELVRRVISAISSELVRYSCATIKSALPERLICLC